jgi:hypothetical protein
MTRRRKGIVADGGVAGSLCGRITRIVAVTVTRANRRYKWECGFPFSLSPLVEGRREPGGEAKDD